MDVFIKASSIGEKLGDNFSAYGSLTQSNKINLTRVDLLGGTVITFSENESSIFIESLDVKTTVIQFNINNQKNITFSAKDLYDSSYREINEETGQIEPFTEGIFSIHLIEEISESIIGDRILLDFLDKSIPFTISYIESVPEESAFIKIGYFSTVEQDGLLPGPVFYFKYYSDQSISPSLEIHDEDNHAFYIVSKENGDQDFKIKEFADTDAFYTVF
jgi:hypothetical protein